MPSGAITWPSKGTGFSTWINSWNTRNSYAYSTINSMKYYFVNKCHTSDAESQNKKTKEAPIVEKESAHGLLKTTYNKMLQIEKTNWWFCINLIDLTDLFRIHRLKYLLAFECVRRYFPIRLIKTVDLQPDRNYLFACYPHGIIPHGIMGNFFTNFTKVTELFPGIEVHVATLEIVFRLPFVREYIMALGQSFFRLVI